jgi:hypothetical protein
LKAVVLTYHSHHVQGPDYARNDHVALPVDLLTIARAGARIVSLATLVEALESQQAGTDASNGGATLVALTFDDGPVYDFADFVHPTLGKQRSFVNAMRDFRATDAGRAQADLAATSFVIASPAARRVMESTFDAEYTFLEPGALGDERSTPASSASATIAGIICIPRWKPSRTRDRSVPTSRKYRTARMPMRKSGRR